MGILGSDVRLGQLAQQMRHWQRRDKVRFCDPVSGHVGLEYSASVSKVNYQIPGPMCSVEELSLHMDTQL